MIKRARNKKTLRRDWSLHHRHHRHRHRRRVWSRKRSCLYTYVCLGCLYCCRCCCDNIIIEAQIARDLCENRLHQNKTVFIFNENNIIIRLRAYRHNIMKYNIILIQRTTTRDETSGAPPSQTVLGAAARYCTASRVFFYGILSRPLCPQCDHPQTPRRSV